VTQTLAHLTTAFQEGTIQDSWGNPLVLRTVPVGDLVIVSGALVACDAIIAVGAAAFTTYVPLGAYPVVLSVATHVNGATSVACAMVRFAPGTAVRWQMATFAGQDDTTLGPGESFGYSVDSGTGCFMDAACLLAILSQDADSPSYEALVDEDEKRIAAILGQMRRINPGWANVLLDQATGANIVAFNSGDGDGVYTSYFGYDPQDRLVCLVTDFEALPDVPSSASADL